MIATLLSPTDSLWRRLLNRVSHDVYQLPEYTALAGHHENGDPVAFYAEDGDHALLVPLLIRALPTELAGVAGGRDATSSYGYSGPVATPGIPHGVMREALARFHEIARDAAIVSAFIRLHPLRSAPTTVLAEHGSVVNHGRIVYIDLSKSLDELWADTRSNHRRNITRLERTGYRVEVDDWNDYPAFRHLYRTTMERRAAAAFYLFTDDYFDELREKLAHALHLFVVRGPDGDVAAAGLFMLVDGIAEYHLGGTADTHLARAPSKLMFDVVRRWAKERGASLLNLGGGVGASDGPLQHFKTGFSSSQADFCTLRVVFDERRYRELVAARRALDATDDRPSDFFPEYRRPVHSRDQLVSESA